MKGINNILLASHGTIGARAAEEAVLNICTTNTNVKHLYIIPDFWKHMLGDDWLNNQITREHFCHYLESELDREAQETIIRMRDQLKNLEINSSHQILFGDPQKCLVNICVKEDFDLVVTGSPRPKSILGLHSRMATNYLSKNLSISHMQVPHPLACN